MIHLLSLARRRRISGILGGGGGHDTRLHPPDMGREGGAAALSVPFSSRRILRLLWGSLTGSTGCNFKVNNPLFFFGYDNLQNDPMWFFLAE